ncbi:putative membrane protein ycf78 [Rhizoctonia solani]|uniref:Putative membrane protein ycf78 n=1 Tax=Rhizoctonia solani TaxID=456999 RepID=A0A0K6G9R3_9AGAM|nr:putative membrane protein ycf78 [Rhizoctonia solani]
MPQVAYDSTFPSGPTPLLLIDTEYTASGKFKYACKFCRGPDGRPLRINKRKWSRHASSAAHSSSQSLNASKRFQAIQCTPHDDSAELEEDISDAYSSSVQHGLGDPILSSSSMRQLDRETTPATDLDFDQPFSESELGDTIHTPEIPLESGYEHWRTAYDSEDSCDDDDDDFDEMFASYLTPGSAQLGDTPSIMGNTSRANRSQRPPLAASDSEPWYPWPSQLMFLADILFTANRLEFSRKQAKAILAFARATGGKDVPTLSGLASTRKRMLEVTGNPTTRYESDTGHIFYVNEDISNPITRENMCFYAHDTGKRVTQVWNATKILKDVSDDLLTPTIRHHNKLYYVNELVRCSNHWFIPLRWVMVGETKAMHADGYMVEESELGLRVIDVTRQRVPVSSFELSYPELQESNAFKIQFAPNSAIHSEKMPHPLRHSAGSRPVYAIPIMVFIDDVSGNLSTQWNKHNSAYMSNGTLPREELNSEYHVRYVTTSPHASPLELMRGVRESIEKSRITPTIAYDCLNHEEVVIRPYLLFIPADNPMQAELCSGCGLSSNRFCRTCNVGGTQEFKRSIEGYPTLFKTGKIRDRLETIETIKKQLGAATKVGGTDQVKKLASGSGIKDQVAQPHIETLLALGKKLNKERNGYSRDKIEGILASELKKIEESTSHMSPLLTMEGVDIHLDTPTEILHTVLLGVVKYFWAQTAYVIDRNKQLDLLSVRLDSLDHSGLNVPSILGEYMVHYRGALIGKHFKTIAQVMPFVLYDNIVEDELRNVWVLLSRLVVQLWVTDIHNMKDYRTNLKALIDDFLIAAAQCSPSIISTKPKFHFLVHISDYICRFGPAVLFSTERFESFNAVFRAASIFSNRRAPSLDIAVTMAHKDRIKHVCSGGFWKNGSHWVHSNKFIQDFLMKNTQFGALVGLVSSDKQAPGTVVLRSEKTRGSCSWADVCKTFPNATHIESAPKDISGEYRVAVSGVSSSGDIIKNGNNVAFGRQFGLIRAVYAYRPNGTGPSEDQFYCSVQLYLLLPEKDPQIDTPMLVLSNNIMHIELKARTHFIAMGTNLNTQGKCLPEELVWVREERELTTRVRKLIKHADDKQFLLNINSLHNSQILERLLPTNLSTRRIYKVDRNEVLKSAVHKMGGVHAEKVAINAAKRKAKSTFAQALTEVKGTTSSSEGVGTIEQTPNQDVPRSSVKRKAHEQSDVEIDPSTQLRRQR